VSSRQRRYGLRWDALVLHCPGPERSPLNPFHVQWVAACDAFFGDATTRGTVADHDALTIITYNNRPEPQLLECCLDHLGLHRYVVLGKGLADWRWSYKIELVHEYLSSGTCMTKYVLCLDGDDVLVLADPALILERYLELGCEMLFCGTRGDWPPSEQCAAFEDSVAADADPAHRHLNAGGYLATTAFLAARLEEIVTAMAGRAPWCTAEHGFDDQLAWRHLHRRHHPSIRVDAGCRVFLRFDEDR
jgi:hypothetical protein